MKYKLSADYSAEEKEFLKANGCEILTEITLSKADFSENECPLRMFRYYGSYIGEIVDDESGEPVWALLGRYKGVYRFTSIYADLKALEENL